MRDFKECYKILTREMVFNDFDITIFNDWFAPKIIIKDCLYKNNFCKLIFNSEIYNLWKENDRYIITDSKQVKQELDDFLDNYIEEFRLIEINNYIDDFLLNEEKNL